MGILQPQIIIMGQISKFSSVFSMRAISACSMPAAPFSNVLSLAFSFFSPQLTSSAFKHLFQKFSFLFQKNFPQNFSHKQQACRPFFFHPRFHAKKCNAIFREISNRTVWKIRKFNVS